ncbi:MAG: right-handed parallel beta-helix repeat-containing protein [Planctomycetota bacterium]
MRGKILYSLAVLLIMASPALGSTTRYDFVEAQSTVVQSGGFMGIYITYSVAGRFVLTVDFGAGVASFDEVDANLSEIGLSFTQDLNELFNMTELVGTVIGDTQIHFVGKNTDIVPVDVNLMVTLADGLVEITGGTEPGCCDFFIYTIDALAVELTTTYYVDDDALGDPGPGDPCVSDPLEDGTQDHPFDAIQEAIDSAFDGDTIVVLPGMYSQGINFLGKNITLRSTDPTNSDIVRGTTIGGIVRFRGTEAPTCLLSGFNIESYIYGFDWEIDPNGKNHTHATISHCVLDNIITGCGRLIYACDGTISNCTVANIAYMCLMPWPAPAIVGCHGLIENCTFVNVADGIKVFESGTCTIKNSILYNHTWAIVPDGATLNISYCNFEGGRVRIWGDGTVNWGPGNIDDDPCFVRIGSIQLEGDYHLKSQAGRWESSTKMWELDDVTSPCIDAGDPMNPIGLEPFPNGGVINMGAYGGTAEASKSYFGEPVCEIIVAGDINGDCKVNFLDFRIMALHWLEDYNPPTSPPPLPPNPPPPPPPGDKAG